MSFPILFRSSSSFGQRWKAELERHIPDLDFRVYPEIGDPAEIAMALVWKPPHGVLATLPNLRLIVSLGAGVDHILEDPTVPRHVPLMRLVDPHMVAAMSEYVLAQVLRLHRQDLTYLDQQRDVVWKELSQPNAHERRIGVLGLGQFGADAAIKLGALGFDVAGWSRSPKAIDGIATFHGDAGFAPFLARSEIVICLLPLTAATESILNAGTFALMPRGGMIINVGRGGHLAEEDLVPALDSGQIGAAVLDVFRTEPLPADHPFWRHPRIVLTPHVAAATNPPTAAVIVADNIKRLRAGQKLQHLVDPELQY
jgi:glyoxylate/hydroxypyruvate reductase A